MHRALDNLSMQPELILVDGNRFIPYKIFTRRNLRALPTTELEERLMAAAAIIGDNRMPKKG